MDHQLVATYLVRKRLFETWAFFPVYISCLLPIAWLSFVSFGHLCTDYFVLALVIFGIGASLMLCLIFNLAATSQTCTPEQNLEKAWKHNQQRLPLALLIVSCVMSRCLGPWIERYGGWNVRIDIPRFSFWTALRLSFATAMLGAVVLARFIGPWSIMRLSSCPLAMNPFTAAFQRWCKDPGVAFLAQESSVPSTSVMGRRWQRLTIQPMAQHILASFAMGYVVAFATARPMMSAVLELNDSASNFAWWAVVCACVLVPVYMLTFVLDSVSHEIDPLLYLDQDPVDSRWFPVVSTKIMRQTGKVTMIVPCLAWFAAMGTTSSIMPAADSGRLLLGIVTMSGAMALYMALLDELLRLKLFHPLADIEKLVQDTHEGASRDDFLRVLLSSLLERPSLVDHVLTPPAVPPGWSLESHELSVWADLSQKMALVYQNPPLGRFETLEDDVLRLSILELYGGRLRVSQPKRHMQAIEFWMKGPKSPLHTASEREPKLDVFVRCLCVCLGGFSEALVQCCCERDQPSSAPSSFEWSIPLGAWTSVEFILMALERCLVQISTHEQPSFLMSARVAAPKQLSFHVPARFHVPALAPVALQSMYLLHRALNRYNQMVNRDAPLGQAVPDDSCTMMIRLCEDTATKVLRSLQAQHGLGKLRRDCLHWAESLK